MAGHLKQAVVVLEEENWDDHYEPTQKEVDQYAEWLGMDLMSDEDRELLWIAKQGLRTALPPEWKPCRDERGEIFYFNFQTQESTWDHPCDETYRKLYQEHKKEQRPRLIGSLHASLRPSGAVVISATNLAGDEFASVELVEGPGSTLRWACAEIKRQLSPIGPELFLILPDGRLLPPPTSRARSLLDLPLEQLFETARRKVEGPALGAPLRAPADGLPPLRGPRVRERGSLDQLPTALQGPLRAKKLRVATSGLSLVLPGTLAAPQDLSPRTSSLAETLAVDRCAAPLRGRIPEICVR